MVEASSYQVDQVARLVQQVSHAVHTVDLRVSEVGGYLTQLHDVQLSLSDRIDQLTAEFRAYVALDRHQKALQLAETRIVKVRQELETSFGHHREVRRRATGILQAMDAALVAHETIQHTTEDVMMRTPGYWLAPALVALAGWIRDDQPLAQRALAESLRRDDHKTSLFFGLVLRRYRREPASGVWVHRYFSHQDPTALDRECMVVLDAVTNGGFGPAAQELTRRAMADWIDQLAAEPGFVDQQRARWHTALLALQPGAGGGYRYLPEYSLDWPDLQDRLGRAHLHATVDGYFRQVFEGEITISPRLSEQVDQILESLVTNFDAEELPLRKQERELHLIIEQSGDQDRAGAMFAAEQEAYEEHVSFAALLTNAAMHSQQSGASPATQRFAIAMSHQWITEAYEQVVAEGRLGIPTQVRMDIDGWLGTAVDGSEEPQLIAAQQAEYAQRAAAAHREIGFETATLVVVALGSAAFVGGLIALVNWVLLFLGAGALVYGFVQYTKLEQRRRDAVEAVRVRHQQAQQVLRACLAEVVDWRAEWAAADANAEAARRELAAISPQQHTRTHGGDSRNLMIG